MNISEDTLKALDKLCAYDLHDNYMGYVNVEAATLISIRWKRGSGGCDAWISRPIRAGSDEVTLDWILKQIDQPMGRRNT